MNLVEQLRVEVSRSMNTLRRRFANTVDRAEKRVIVEVIDSLNRKLRALDRAELLEAASTLGDASEDLEKAIAGARAGPFDGYLAALEEHLRALNVLSGEMHAAERLWPAPDDGVARAAPARRGRGKRAPGLPSPLSVKDFSQLKDEYQTYYDACKLRPEHAGNLAYYVKRLNQKRAVYEQVAADMSGMPWAFIGVIHGMECGFNFAAHLHNGDSLTARTLHVPAGRPLMGSPPFTWRESASDALRLKRFHEVTDWSIPRMLYLLERYNGFGYRMRSLPTPYLWSFSNHYTKGKFVSDGQFDPNAVSKQCGAALMLQAVMPKPRARRSAASRAKAIRKPK
jgi:lysozyme family protein